MPVSFPTNKNSRNGRRKAEPYGGGGASGPYTVTTNIDTTYLNISGEIPEEVESGGSLEHVIIYPKSSYSSYYISQTFSITMGGVDITDSCTQITRTDEGYINGVSIDIAEVTGDLVINIPLFPRCAITFMDRTSTYATITTAVDYTDVNGQAQTTTGFPENPVCMYPGSKVKVHLSSENSVKLYFQGSPDTLLGEGTALGIEFTAPQAAAAGGFTFNWLSTEEGIGLTTGGDISTMTASDFTVTTD